jgi:hypothetical protein
VVQQATEALHGQGRAVELAAPEALPQLVVDRAERKVCARRTGQAEPGERLRQGDPLRPVEVEQRVVGVEEDGARPRQGRGYLAR